MHLNTFWFRTAILALFLVAAQWTPLLSQTIDSTALTKNFKFADGLYLSQERLLNNAPNHHWSDLEIAVYTNPKTLITKIKSTDYEFQRQLWAIVIDGVPFIRVPQQKDPQELTSFAALKIRGHLSYFSFPEREIRKIPITAYNPANGRPFRQGIVERDEVVLKEYLVHFPTGKIAPFGKATLLEFITTDTQLTEAVQRLDEQQHYDQLFKSIQIFDDRHPIFLPTMENFDQNND